eukprot:m.220961 g.220961  ORF g.220961 m.220961 type:complete len:300 (+) comp10486_c0_seq1:592-1491(+)
MVQTLKRCSNDARAGLARELANTLSHGQASRAKLDGLRLGSLELCGLLRSGGNAVHDRLGNVHAAVGECGNLALNQNGNVIDAVLDGRGALVHDRRGAAGGLGHGLTGGSRNVCGALGEVPAGGSGRGRGGGDRRNTGLQAVQAGTHKVLDRRQATLECVLNGFDRLAHDGELGVFAVAVIRARQGVKGLADDGQGGHALGEPCRRRVVGCGGHEAELELAAIRGDGTGSRKCKEDCVVGQSTLARATLALTLQPGSAHGLQRVGGLSDKSSLAVVGRLTTAAAVCHGEACIIVIIIIL